jgi:hypothetical protein
MPIFKEHASGMPCWIDSMVSNSVDRIALIDFFTKVFDWQFELGTEEMGYYSIARSNGEPVLGIGEQVDGRGVWVTYFTTEDIQATCQQVTVEGAQVFFPPIQIMNLGWMALVMDPVGVLHGLWQPIDFHGFGVLYEPNSLGWFDHVSENIEEASKYYKSVLNAGSMNEGEMKVLTRGEQWFASISYGNAEEQPAQWMPVYVVDSLERIKTKVRSLGGEIIIEEMEVPGSAISVFREPVMKNYITVMAAGAN